MALDLQPITGSDAIVAARLCNFPTGKATLLGSHIAWLDSAVRAAVTGPPNPWVDLRGYASHLGFAQHPGGLGNAALNKRLSFARCEAVKARIVSYGSNVSFPMEWAVGDAESSGTMLNDDGYWRAVDVYAYATKPIKPPEPPKPQGPPGSTQFKVRIFAAAGASIFIEGDAMVFQIVDVTNVQCGVYYYLGAGVSIPGLKFSLPGSIAKAGPFADFSTSRPVWLDSFTGEASVYQNPGASVGPLSIGGTVYLAPTSPRLRRLPGTRSTVVVPELIPMSTGSGFSLGLGSLSTGSLSPPVKFLPGDCCGAKGGICTGLKEAT
jgi:hypothetical protein